MTSLLKDEDIFTKLQYIIVDALRVDLLQVKPNSRLFTDLKAESLDLLDIRFRIEEEFKFKIPQREIIEQLGKELNKKEIEQLFTVKSLVDYIKNRLSEDVSI